MKTLLLTFCTIVCGFLSGIAQTSDSVAMAKGKLVVTSLRKPSVHVPIDTSGMLSVVCVIKRDSLIREEYRSLQGKVIGYNDTSCILLVENETVTTYKRDGTMDNFFYWRSEDSLHHHVDTLQFSQIHSLRYDKGRFRAVIGIMQSTSYLYILGNIAVLITAIVVPKKYDTMASGGNLLLTTGGALALGGSSFLFYPKVYKVNPLGSKRQRISWKLEYVGR